MRFYKGGKNRVQAFDSDYSSVISGLLELYSVTGTTKWLSWAFQLQEQMDSLFWDQTSGEPQSPSPDCIHAPCLKSALQKAGPQGVICLPACSYQSHKSAHSLPWLNCSLQRRFKGFDTLWVSCLACESLHKDWVKSFLEYATLGSLICTRVCPVMGWSAEMSAMGKLEILLIS